MARRGSKTGEGVDLVAVALELKVGMPSPPATARRALQDGLQQADEELELSMTQEDTARISGQKATRRASLFGATSNSSHDNDQ